MDYKFRSFTRKRNLLNKILEMKNAISKIKKLKRWAYQKIEGIPQKITNSKNRSIECINSEETE